MLGGDSVDQDYHTGTSYVYVLQLRRITLLVAKLVDAYALAEDSTTVHQQGVLTYKLYAISRI